jgi:hypothetical protein
MFIKEMRFIAKGLLTGEGENIQTHHWWHPLIRLNSAA